MGFCAAIRPCRRLRPEVGREAVRNSGLGRWFLPRARTRVSDGKLDANQDLALGVVDRVDREGGTAFLWGEADGDCCARCQDRR